MRAGGAARLAAVAFSTFVAACSTLPPGALDRTIEGRTVAGRLSVRYTDLANGKEDGSSGRFVWTTQGDLLELSLLDPLGQTVALIRSDSRRASIVLRDGRRFDGATPEALTQETLGWTVPLQGLGFWLEGRTEPATAVTTLADGAIRQDGWTIRFQRDVAPSSDGNGSTADASGDAPPKRIDLSYPGPPASIEMRLVVDQRSGT